MTNPIIEAGPAANCGHGHLAEFYESDSHLVDAVADFLAPALRGDGAVVIVATPEHRVAFAAALRAEGVDLDLTRVERRYVVLDAAETLASLMVDGNLDPSRFRQTIGSVVDGMADGGGVRVYGEMVALLWHAGDVTSTIALEDLWNDLAAERDFLLLCGYPMGAFEDGSGADFKKICLRHTDFNTSADYERSGEPAEERRAAAELRQETSALRAELSQVLAEKDRLVEMAYADSLTGLANRRAFDVDLEREWKLTHRDGIDSFVVLADLDGFKALNDSLGHAVGDEVLRRFADALRAAGRSTDVHARIGGDEFGILLVRCDERAAHTFASHLWSQIAQNVCPGLGPLSVSLGHSSLLDFPSPADALECADLAMLANKRAARDSG